MQLADSTPAAVGVRVVAIMPSDSGNYIAGHTGVISRLNNPFAIVRWDHSAEEHTSKCAKLEWEPLQKHGGSDEPVLESGWGMAPELVGQTLSFDRCSVELTPSTTATLNDTVTKTSGNWLVDDNKGAGCNHYVMSTGQHYAEFKMLNLQKDRIFCMVGRPTADVESGFSLGVWGVLKTGRYVHAELGSTARPEKYAQDWPPGQDQGRKDAIAPGHKNTVFVQGDRLGMLVDCDRGVLAIYKNGALLGIATRELPSNEPLCFGVGLRADGDSVQILAECEMPAELPDSLRGKLRVRFHIIRNACIENVGK